MWMAPGWPVWPAQQPPPPRPSQRDRVLSRVRHPSCTPEQVDGLLRGMSSRQLRRLWVESTELLLGPLEPEVLANVVALRANLLDRLDPELDAAWLREASGR